MRLNGWQRLWLMTAILWAVFVVGVVAILQSKQNETIPLINAIGFWGVPAVVVYALGFGVAWVRRGFRPDSK
jgi:predicted membrane-bound mannosyltransferase